jgi:hypothetical protein
MPTLSQLIAAHEARQPAPLVWIVTPKAEAIDALHLFVDALGACDAADRAHVLELLRDEVLALPATA